MKKVMIAAAAFAVLGLASCKKDYTCACTTTDSSSTPATSVTLNSTITASKKDAKAACEKTQTVATVSTTCVIK